MYHTNKDKKGEFIDNIILDNELHILTTIELHANKVTPSTKSSTQIEWS